MNTTHIDTLAEWWENAEHAPFRKGDMLISRREGEPVTYEVYPAGCDHNVPADNVRILARAPKPKPAWHDAVAVIATFRDGGGMVTGVWAPEGSPGYWEGPGGDVVAASVLENVTPLIEAKVTDEMVERGYYAENTTPDGLSGPQYVRRILTAALGLDPA